MSGAAPALQVGSSGLRTVAFDEMKTCDKLESSALDYLSGRENPGGKLGWRFTRLGQNLHSVVVGGNSPEQL